MTDSEGNEIGKLFIGGLSQATNNASLRIYFSRFGEVDDAVVMMDNKTGRSRGFGYVKYREPESVNLALETKPHILDGKEVDAKQCNINMKGRNRRSLKIFVGGIGLDQDAESIKNFFRQFGRVTDVNLMMDSNKQRHRGFAFVGFEDESVVKRLIALHYVMMNSKQVEIKAMEPPNFGRKVGPSTCLTTATIINTTNTPDVNCGHGFENNPETGGILAPSFVNPLPYLQAQASGVSCLATSMPTSTRANPAGIFEQPQAAFSTTLDQLYQPTTYIQPINGTTKTTENIPLAGTYMGSKQPVPFVVASGHYHPATLSQNSSSIYAPIPYQLLSPTYIPATQQPLNATQIVGPNKSATSGWPMTTLQCSSHIPTTNNIISCSSFTPTQNPVIPSPQAADLAAGIGQILTPYYTLCPQYATVSLQSDQSVGTPFAIHQLMGTHVATAGSETTAGTGSRSQSPVAESGLEQSTANKVTYPAIVMTGGGLQNPQVVAPTSHHAMGQNLWNQPQSNLLYSPLPMGWTVPQPPGVQQNWASQPVNMIPQPMQTPSASAPPGTEVTTTENAQPKETSTKPAGLDPTKLVQAQASGDSMDSVMVSTAQAHTDSVTSYLKTNDKQKTGQIIEKNSWQETEAISNDSLLSSNSSWSSPVGRRGGDRISTQPWNVQSETSENRQTSPGDQTLEGRTTVNNSPSSVRQVTVDQIITPGSNTTQDVLNNARNITDSLRHRQPTTIHSLSTSSGRMIQTIQGEVGKSKMNGTCETDYTPWLFHKVAEAGSAMDSTAGGKKDLPTNNSVEMECQGPAGAAGDFHHPVHTGHYSSYHMAH